VNPVLELDAPGILDQDDMCIWIHPTDKSLSTIISADKASHHLFVYDLQGNVLQTIDVASQHPGGIDIRYNFLLGGELTDIIGYDSRATNTVHFYKVNRNTRLISFINSIPISSNYGFCMYKSPVTGKYYCFASNSAGNIFQYELSDNNADGIIEGTFVRQMNNNGNQNTEGMVADDQTGILYAANEILGIYKFDAEPNGPLTSTLVAATGVNGLTADVEGLAIYYLPDGNGYLIASSQGSDDFKVYDRQPPHNFIKTIEVNNVGETDGIDVTSVSLGPSFPFGMILTHDGTGAPHVIRGSRWEDVELVVDTSYWDPRTSPFSFTTNVFGVIGDYGSAGDDAVEWVADMVKSWDPEYVITTGDNSYGNTPIDQNIGQFYSKFIFPYSGFYPPGSPDENRFWISVGNHDYDDGGGINAMRLYFPYLVPDTYYDIVIGDVHFFMLDSEEYSSYSGAQKTWFDNAAANSTSLWRIAVFHHPPYTSGTHTPTLNMRNWPFDANDFHLVFTGHNHNMEHLTVPGQQTQYVVQGAGGRSLYSFPLNPSPAASLWNLSEYGACRVLVSPDNFIVEFWSTDGSVNTLEYSFSLNNPLPVELSYFAGEVFNDNIKLKWRTESEVGNYGFEVQKSEARSQEIEWNTIGFVQGHGNSNSPKDYFFIDADAAFGMHAYRLKQIDTDGDFEYSNVIEINFGTPSKFELSQNYPNPFNPVTTIKFSIPQPGNVNLKIYNLLGEEVATLLNSFLDAGFHAVDFDASGFNSGFYIYKLTAGNSALVRKMMIVK